MAETIGDALVLTLKRGASLKEWRDAGLLAREWALYQRLTDDYGKIVLVTWGDREDEAIFAENRGLFGENVSLLCNAEGLETDRYRVAVIERAAALLGDAKRIVIKTNQMAGGELAVRLARRLRERGHRVGLIARGGFLVSRFLSSERGPASVEAKRAGGEEAELCRAADLIIGTSPAMIGDLAWRYGLEPERMREIPNYVLVDDTPIVTHEASERTPGSILYAGQLVERKRIDLIIESIADLPESTRETAHLTVIGEGPERDNLERLAGSLGVSAEFKPRMSHEELRELYTRTCIYAQMSRLEGHPKTVLEAMAAGCAVVVAQAPGLASAVQHGVTGLVVPPQTDAIAHTFDALLGDEEMRLSFGLAAHDHVRQRYGLDRVISRERAAHTEALKNAGFGATVPSELVRWDPELLLVEPALGASAIWAGLSSLGQQMGEDDRCRLLERLGELLDAENSVRAQMRERAEQRRA